MDYETAYKEAFEKAKKVLLDCTPDERNVVEYIFPELKVSEDETIRQALIKYYSFNEDGHSHALDNITPEQIVAWLEKQGEQKSKNESTDTYDSLIIKTKEFPASEKRDFGYFSDTVNKAESKFKDGDWIVYKDAVWKVCNIALQNYYELLKTNNEVATRLIKDVDENAHLWTINDAQDGDIIYAESKFVTFDFIYIFSEIKNENSWAYCSVDSDCDDLDGDSRHWCFDNCKGSIELDRYNFYPATKEQRDILFAKMKEEGYGWDSDNKEVKELEQSPTDMVKSGFHEGDWITFYGGCAFKIVKIESEQNGILDYLLLDQNGHESYYNKKYVDENARLWTIQDAKPGDVLVCPKYANDIIPNIFIFKDIETKDNDVYCYCSFLKTFTTGGYVASADPIDTDFYPATKEQCDILFQKMEEAGYMWDSKNVELQKIEQNSNDMPNLKVGDWVVREDGKKFHDGNKFTKINKINGIMCFLNTGKWIYNFEIRPWSIYDAEPGDMLCWDNCNCIVMFRNIIDSESFASYGYVGSVSNRFSRGCCFHEIKGVHPASTERCLRLHKAMTEEGYVWDNKKKELIKLKL